MRHLFGIILAIVMAGVLAAGTWGYLRLTTLAGHLSRLPGGGGSLLSGHGARAALIAVAGAGLLAGILVAMPRISPLAPGLPGLLLLGAAAAYMISTSRVADLIHLRSSPYGPGPVTMLSGGILGAVGLMMTIPIFIPSRWRSRARAAKSAVAETSGLTTGMQEIVEPPEPERLAGHPRLASPARTPGFPPSQPRHGPRPSGSGQPGVTGGDAAGRAGQRLWQGGPGPRRSANVRMSSPWRLPDA
jgi:hypothetical protein